MGTASIEYIPSQGPLKRTQLPELSAYVDNHTQSILDNVHTGTASTHAKVLLSYQVCIQSR